ncbi:MAG TPA: LON peptidase substrate-binding domain-containing protein [Pseudomonas sp.]|jgi:Lon protease-like protein|nr:LON peptidase substrate-binding domain-containing protein [Pseudomonas sp.]
MTLPLFPLDTVLFPGCNLDLQLFEPRYLDMLSGCLKRGEGFGVVTLLVGSEVGKAPTSFSEVGCEALIRDWRQQPNGLLGIRVEGGRRLRVDSSRVQPDQLTLGEVQWLTEGEDPPLGDEHPELQQLLQALVEHPLVSALGMTDPVTRHGALADRLAYLLPFDNTRKLRLLACLDPRERLAMLDAWLDALQGE